MPDLSGKSPAPRDSKTSARLSRVRQQNTSIELALRKELHRRGLRYGVHRRPLPALRRTADIVFVRARVAVFVDGCFWHSCPDHGSLPASNSAWWKEKLAANVLRDRDTDERLIEAGWLPVRVWGHEEAESAANRVANILAERGFGHDK